MDKYAINGTIDKCIKCGKLIKYDKLDGYWDSTEKKHLHTLYCNRECDSLHEPINYISDDKGYYFRKEI